MTNDERFYTGQLLLAMPGIGDHRFERAVIAICSHNEEGAFGIDIGHPAISITLRDLLGQFDIDTTDLPNVPVFAGGPVEPQRGFVLHSVDWAGQGTVNVAGKWGLSSSIDILRVIGRPEGPRRWLVALGYAGWGAGQLDGELLRHGWHIADGSNDLLFETTPDARWEGSFRNSGIDPRLLASESGHA